ncbi:MAG TPA: NF038122 family metalloprotease [Bryobacteraceae bacterium]
MRQTKFLRLLVVMALLLGANVAGAMTIVLNPGASLAANQPALDAFQRAADAWSHIFSDPITVVIDADVTGGFGNPNIIGQTSAAFLTGGYDLIRNQLVADSAGKPDKAIVSDLPTAAQFQAFLPTGFTLSGGLAGTSADLKAMGFDAGLIDSITGGVDATITFNSAFPFYYGTGTVPAGEMDFTTVATHEIGHALGFDSAVDDLDFFLGNPNPGNPTSIDVFVLDLYRFKTAGLPTNAANFTTTPRSLVPNDPASFSDVSSVYAMSTGAFTGDGNQASHWKADEITSTFIGIMDPTLNFAVRENITAADIRSLELIGYDIAAPEPGTMALGAGALLALAAVRRKRVKA